MKKHVVKDALEVIVARLVENDRNEFARTLVEFMEIDREITSSTEETLKAKYELE